MYDLSTSKQRTHTYTYFTTYVCMLLHEHSAAVGQIPSQSYSSSQFYFTTRGDSSLLRVHSAAIGRENVNDVSRFATAPKNKSKL